MGVSFDIAKPHLKWRYTHAAEWWPIRNAKSSAKPITPFVGGGVYLLIMPNGASGGALYIVLMAKAGSYRLAPTLP